MSERKQIHQEFLTGERALFASNDLDIYDTIFDDGESPLKESHGISLTGLKQIVEQFKISHFRRPSLCLLL